MDAERRHLITLAVRTYQDPELCEEEIGPSEQRVVEVLKSFGYRHVLSLEAERSTIFDQLSRWLRDASPRRGTLILYVIAHGQADPQYGHVLLMRDHGSRARQNTIISPAELASAVAGHGAYSRVLCIFESCFAGAGESDMVAAVADELTRSGSSVELVATTTALARAVVAAFSTALETVLSAVHCDAETWRTQGPYLSLADLLHRVDSHLLGGQVPLGPLQRLRHARAGGVTYTDKGFFPNPHHDPDLPMQQTLEVEGWLVASRGELRDHWLSRARGVPSGFGFGWYFEGRQALLASLESFILAASSDGMLRVVTGSPGAGKSAVLAYLVMRAHGALRERSGPKNAALPQVVALWARRKTLAALVNELAKSAGVSLSGSRPRDRAHALLEALRHRTAPLPIVLDALDEASEPAAIARDFLAELAGLSCTRVIVGTQRQLLPELGNARLDFDLDKDDATQAMSDYVKARLLREQEPYRPSPYRGQRELARAVGIAVAERARPLFLVAQLVADALLLEPEPVDPHDRGWLARLPRATDEAFAMYLDRIGSGLERERVVRSLLPLAYAQGGVVLFSLQIVTLGIA